MTKDEVQVEALNATKDKKRCTVVLGTGVGKTLVGLTHIDSNTTLLERCLVVAPKKSIFQSWIDDATKFDMQELLDRIEFTTYLSLNKKNPNDYDIIYLDECHSLLNSHKKFLDNYTGKILGLTGTPPKYRNSEKGVLVDKYCPVIYSFKADDAVENKILNDYQIIVHKVKLDTNDTFFVKTKKGGYYTSEYKNYMYWSRLIEQNGGTDFKANILRMKAMQDYPSKERYTKLLMKSINSKCIIFANTQDQADRLCDYSYHSNNENSEENLKKFKSGEIDKLSTVLQLSEGVNIPNLKQGIIMHAYGNERKSAQRIGRLLRLNPDDKAIVHILCYGDTVDKKWVENSLSEFDSSKINWVEYDVKY